MNGNAVIFSDEEMRMLDPGGGPFWTPTLDQVEALESLLPDYLRLHPPRDDRPIERVFDYGRQYYGVTRNGQSVIYVNAFCHPEGFAPQWKKDIIVVKDGGSCYFQGYFDPLKKQFVGLRYNGQA